MARNTLLIQFSQQSFDITKMYIRSTGFAVEFKFDYCRHNQFAILLQWKLS